MAFPGYGPLGKVRILRAERRTHRVVTVGVAGRLRVIALEPRLGGQEAGTAADRPITRPFESSARTANTVAELLRSSCVSNERLRVVATRDSEPALWPARNCHLATFVAPFQLA